VKPLIDERAKSSYWLGLIAMVLVATAQVVSLVDRGVTWVKVALLVGALALAAFNVAALAVLWWRNRPAE
jgi:hypothetical protein